MSLALLLNALMQVFDAVLGLVRQDVLQTVSPVVIALALFAAAAAVLRSGASASAAPTHIPPQA